MNKEDLNSWGFNTVIVVGNGFDLDLGLKTSYSSFINSDLFQNLKKDCEFAQHVEQQKRIKNWVDLEEELYLYANSGEFIQDIRIEYGRIKETLKKYISTQSLNDHELRNSTYLNKLSYQLIEKYIGQGPLIVDFNYTDSVQKIIKQEAPQMRNFSNYYHINIHGSVQNEIIFGVHEGSLKNLNHGFLVKAMQNNFVPPIIYNKLIDAHKVIFFGHSMGITDHSYFTPYFEHISNLNYNEGKQDIHIYNSGNDGIQNFIIEISKIINPREMSEFKNKSNIREIDVNLLDQVL